MTLDQATTPVDGRPQPPSGNGRAGRNLPVAIAVGVTLGACVLASLYTYKTVFVGVVAAAVLVGLWELTTALRQHDLEAPFLLLAAGGLSIVALAYARGAEGMVVAAVLTAAAVVVWRLAEAPQRYLADVAAGLFSLAYVPFLASFAVLLLAPHDGPDREVVFIATVVASDVGGYAVGVLVGRHPMAPSISPKKSWEGFAGSVVACGAVGGWLASWMLGAGVYEGIGYGLAVVCAATLGDLGESMVKRDLGIKDMGTLLPGHGGLMDRLDSLLVTAPVAWLLLSAVAPVG